MRKSVRDQTPKTYGVDAFDVKCRITFEDGSSGDDSRSPDVVIFDEKGLEFAATYILCPISSENKNKIPKQVKYSCT